jgi:lysine-specific demethylase/histidyl-hydroxylase NO66
LTTDEGRVAELDHPALRRCVGVAPETFARDYWGTRHLLTRAACLPGGFADLLDLPAVDELLSCRGLRTPFLRMAKDGTVIPTSRFTRPGGAGAEIGDQVADDRVAALFADGATIVLQALHRLWPPIVDFAGSLTTELGHPVQVNAYVTPPQSRGFSSHYDVHDVFVLQLAGTKRWQIHEPVFRSPLRDQPWTDRRDEVTKAAAESPALDVVLEPGDALYLPRGYPHAAEALGGVSAHLTVGVHNVTRAALVEALVALAFDDEELRTSLPLGTDLSAPAQLASVLADTVSALTARLHSADADEVASRVRGQVWNRSRPAPVGPLAQAAAAAAVSTSTVLRLRPGLRALLQDSPDAPAVVLPDRRLALPRGSGPAVGALIDGRPHEVGAVPGLDEDEALALARLLLREAVVVPVSA